MAKYTIHHTCGCTSTAELYGKESQRQWRIEQMEQEDCADCAAQGSDLSGSPKQVTWAEKIRADYRLPPMASDFFKRFASWVRCECPGNLEEISARLRQRFTDDQGQADLAAFNKALRPVAEEALRDESSAHEWIEHRDDLTQIWAPKVMEELL